MKGVSRRTILRLAVASAAAPAMLGTKAAQAEDCVPQAEFDQFIAVSAVLTGIDASFLNPKVDPIGVKTFYFVRVRQQPKYSELVRVFSAACDVNDKEKRKAATAIIENQDEQIAFLA